MKRLFVFLMLSALMGTAHTTEPDPRQLIRSAMDHWRGETSYSEMTMTIRRPEWERSMSMRAWSKGTEQSLVRVTEPKKDAGNGTLLDDNSMWTYTPKVNRIIKVPSSMMSQSWMGSDFSNKDISKSTDIIDQYEHSLEGMETLDGHEVYIISATPLEDAAVVWGREVLWVRDDFLLMEHQFWDQDGTLVKTMKTLEIQEMDGRSVATLMRMGKTDSPQEWTQIEVGTVDFDLELPTSTFTLSNLRNPRR